MADPATNEIYIIDGKSRITLYTPDFFPIHTMGKSDGIESPQGMTIDEKGYVYVVQSESDNNPKSRISVYNPCLKWERDIYISGLEGAEAFSPYRIAADSKGNFYVAANYYPGVLYINSEGSVLDIISPEKEGKKVQISSVTLDQEGKLYLVSEDQSRIYVYDENRTLLVKFGEKGGSAGKLSRPRGVGTDIKSGRMYVVDYMRHTVTVYNRDGKYMFEFGGMGWSEGWFQHPSYLIVDKLGRIIVADTFNQRVQVFNSW
jgi:DNA-binding beta-propeller fold protein YncE